MEWNTKYKDENSEHAYSQIISVRETNGSLDVSTPNNQQTRTQQQFKEQCDVNNIVRKYQITGEFTHLSQKIGAYSDISEVPDYQTMIHQIKDAENAFMDLPATTRARFKNDPGQLMAFLKDSKNYDEGVKLGLLNKRPEQNEQIQTNDKKQEPIK